MDVSAPFEIEGVFYSFPMAALTGFDDIARLTREMATVPPDMDDQYYATKGPDYDAQRSEVYSLPDLEAAARREAEDAMRKRAPALMKKLGSPVVPRSDDGDGWRRRKGHFAFTDKQRRAPLEAAVDSAVGIHCESSGDFLYPANGYRSWHTNRHDEPGWRMYLIQVAEPEASFFRFVHPETGELVTVWDTPDSVNLFPIRADVDLWHCIVSETTNRFSQGFVVPSDWSDRLT